MKLNFPLVSDACSLPVAQTPGGAITADTLAVTLHGVGVLYRVKRSSESPGPRLGTLAPQTPAAALHGLRLVVACGLGGLCCGYRPNDGLNSAVHLSALKVCR